MSTDAFVYCAGEVRRDDRDRYLTALFAPAARRGGLLALFAFNLEIAKAPEAVSQPLLGEMRLQWWRESLDGLFAGTPRRQQVLQGLAAAAAETPLAREHFEAIIDARARDLYDEPVETLAELEAYAEATAGRLNLLALQALGVKDAVAEAAAREIGVAWALIGLMRALPVHARRRRLHLPLELLAAEGIPAEDVYRGRFSEGMGRAVAAVTAAAEQRLAAARARRGEVPKAALPALLTGVLADAYAARLRAASFNPFAADLDLGPLRPPLLLAWQGWLGRY